MTSTHTTLIAALCVALLPPTLVAAQEAGSPKVAASPIENLASSYSGAVELGIAPQSADSFVFGKYTGTTDRGAFGIGNLLVRGRDKWDSGSARYWEVLGTRLGLTSREISARYGNQGLWGVSFSFSQLPFYQSDSAWTIFGNGGSAALTVPTSLPLNTTPALGLQLAPYLHPQDFSLERKSIAGGASFQPSSDWVFTTNVSHEHKDGLKEQSLSVNVRTDPAFFPEPVNYDTDTFEASAAYNRQAAQFQVGYTFSNFANKDAAVLLPSPFLGVLQQPVGALSQYALPASSSAHDVNFSSGYSVTPTTRININLGSGLQLQNESLLPYTRNTNFAMPALPRNSLDGRVQTYLAQVKASSEPLKKLNLSASYTYDKRDNKTPSDPYLAMQEPEWVSLLMWSVPYGFTSQLAKADGSYRFWTGNKLALGYEHRQFDRTFGEVTTQKESTGRVKVSQDFGVGTGYVSYLYGSRTGSLYQPYAFDLALGNLPATTPLLPYPNNGLFSGYNLEPNYYQFRRFFEADRTRNELRAGSTFDLAEGVSLEVFGRRTKDDYRNSPFGMQGSNSWSGDADISYAPGNAFEFHGFYTYESIANDQRSLASTGIVTNVPTAQWTWNSNYRDRVHSLGVGATWQVIEDVLKVGPSVQIISASTDIDVVSGAGAGTSYQFVSKPVPTITSISRGAKLYGEYTVRRNAVFRVVYDFEKLRAADPFFDTGAIPGAATTSLATGVTGAPSYGWLLGGDTNGSYTVHLVTASVIWRF